ncbi:hypothetical protein [Parasitella parasitica]|uniref:Reverse transcriptase domain-containing protein n=1 Tax=Parasitella parasitica TaxID=35722 RepID=A0A0B7N9V8_9FUNG|nr:hypothetical protein [Parasitella parasitica]
MRKPIYSLSRKLGRMSWNKYNLYNIAHKELVNFNNKTLFQQKWIAKRETRAYHGDEVTERQFKSKYFDPKLPTVHSAADGGQAHPPVAVLSFAELERRLDFVVFRSNFCPSIYAARQLCVHGKVLVNGKKLAYPSHKLKDGDIVTVDPQAIQFLKGEKGQELEFTPKPFSQPFLFVPEYLEVNYNTCQTVFLRSPISRPGRTEIPSPFPPEFHSLAYEYYARTAVALRVYSGALLHGVFPQSWQETCLVLLPKKGDLSLLQDWRPISLICCDAKIFTRLLNARLMLRFSTRLSISQSGLMPQRSIGEPAMILHCAQSLATATQSDNTQVQVNINGNLSAPFVTHRGMRQGDPISPLLFNIIFDPFLRAINSHQDIQGFDFDHIAHTNFRFPIALTNHVPVADPVKVLAYADDTLVFLNDLDEFHQFSTAGHIISLVHRTKSWIAGLRATGISSWHDKSASNPITYLGYPICSSPVPSHPSPSPHF